MEPKTRNSKHWWLKVWIVTNVITAVSGFRLLVQEAAFLFGSRSDIVPAFEGRDFPTLSKFMLAYYAVGFVMSCVFALGGAERLRSRQSA